MISRLVVFLSALALGSGLASAGTILIKDLTDGSPTVTASADAASILTILSCSAEQCSFTLSPISTAATNVSASGGSRLTNMVEPDRLMISDTLFTTLSTATLTTWQFNSDVEGTPLPPLAIGAVPNVIVENGQPQTVLTLTYFNAAGAQVGSDIVQIQSDLEGTPEPSTWFTALSGLGLLGWALRRRTNSL